MKKALIAGTALVAAGMVAAGPAAASEKIKLELGGYSKWWVVGAWQDDSYEAGTAMDYANVDVKGDNEVWFSGSTKLDNGLVVGINIELEAGGDQAHTNDTIDKNYAYIESAYGKVIIGTEANGTALLHVMSPDAAGNIDADGVLTGGLAIVRPANVSNMVSTSIDTDAEAEGITYVAPTFYGLTLGGSYKPSTSEDNRNAVQGVEIYGIGANYTNTFGPVGVKASAGWVTYDNSASTVNNNEYSTGIQLAYSGFTLGTSYRMNVQNDGSSSTNGASAITTDNSGYMWDAGLTYATGPYTVGFYYMRSEVEGLIANNSQDVFEVYQVSAAYNLGAGVDLLATVGHAEYDDESQKSSGNTGDVNHNEGWAVMTGLSLTF